MPKWSRRLLPTVILLSACPSSIRLYIGSGEPFREAVRRKVREIYAFRFPGTSCKSDCRVSVRRSHINSHKRILEENINFTCSLFNPSCLSTGILRRTLLLLPKLRGEKSNQESHQSLARCQKHSTLAVPSDASESKVRRFHCEWLISKPLTSLDLPPHENQPRPASSRFTKNGKSRSPQSRTESLRWGAVLINVKVLNCGALDEDFNYDPSHAIRTDRWRATSKSENRASQQRPS